jgi:hypothetical protein
MSLKYNKPEYSLIIKKASLWVQTKEKEFKLKKNYQREFSKLIIK